MNYITNRKARIAVALIIAAPCVVVVVAYKSIKGIILALIDSQHEAKGYAIDGYEMIRDAIKDETDE
ncbi:MAG: hypothetical protein ACRDC4_06905 [Plesiomonas sp.]